MSRRVAKRPRFSVGGQPVFENEDSSNHSGLGMIDYDDSSLSQQPETSTNSSDQQHFVPDRSKSHHQSIVKSTNESNTNLNACLDHLFRMLSRKDKEGFFQYPVTDQIAPGYSNIITHPMDFSTIKKKVSHDEYSNILEFQHDFELMCNNAMKYNRPETVYWQAGKKLLASGTKLLTKDKIMNLHRTVECFSRLTERELGFRLDSINHINDEQTINSSDQMDTSSNENENINNQNSTQRKSKLVLKLPRYYEKLPTLLADEEDDEELSPEEILSQAQQAAKCAREKLSLRRPISAYTLSCQRTNGTTSLRFINQDDLIQQQQSQTRVITIGELSNMASSAGGPSANVYSQQPTPIINENEKRNRLLPRYFLDYGPFSSNAPQYDSSFSTLSKDELDLLIHTYGSEFSAQYAVSLIDYVKDSGDIAISYVDRFLSSLTNGKHENIVAKQQNTLDEQLNKDENSINGLTTSIESSDLIKYRLDISSNFSIQHDLDMKLDENAKLLVQLRQAQYDRLSQPSNKIHQIIPSTSSQQQQTLESLNENDLAEKILSNLCDVSYKISTGPEHIISPSTIRHNLGVVLHDDSFKIDTL